MTETSRLSQIGLLTVAAAKPILTNSEGPELLVAQSQQSTATAHFVLDMQHLGKIKQNI